CLVLAACGGEQGQEEEAFPAEATIIDVLPDCELDVPTITAPAWLGFRNLTEDTVSLTMTYESQGRRYSGDIGELAAGQRSESNFVVPFAGSFQLQCSVGGVTRETPITVR
ncbi:unnamed protein product, partial [marine sediment metagenome]